MATIADIKTILRENEIPFFTDTELQKQLDDADGDLDTAVYNCAVIKAEKSALTISGLSLADTSAYWLRIASLYRPSNTKIVG